MTATPYMNPYLIAAADGSKAPTAACPPFSMAIASRDTL